MTDTVWPDLKTDKLMYIDQTLLPNEKRVCECCDLRLLYGEIKRLAIRGAPAIGVGAAIGFYAFETRREESEAGAFMRALRADGEYLVSSRPTAVNLSWAVKRMLSAAGCAEASGTEAMKEALKREALAIYNEDIATCRAIGENGAALIAPGARILTHCNAGALAAVRYGTALAPVYLAQEQGKNPRVYADETRPLLQGARLTAWELAENGVDVTLICDNMAASLMAKGEIDAVFVGADRIAANGDAANKIGTLSVAVNAKHFGVPFYVCAPFSTIDFECPDGNAIVIEQRAPEEVTTMHYKRCMTHPAAKVYNPAFDVTPARLITGIITEKGVYKGGELPHEQQTASCTD